MATIGDIIDEAETPEERVALAMAVAQEIVVRQVILEYPSPRWWRSRKLAKAQITGQLENAILTEFKDPPLDLLEVAKMRKEKEKS